MRNKGLAIWIVLGLTALAGCGEGGIKWFQFGKPQPQVEPEPEAVEGTVLATVNSRVITLEDFNKRIETFNRGVEASKDIPDSVKANYLIKTGEDKQGLLSGIVERELLISEAIDRGLGEDKDLLRAVEDLKEQYLFAKMIELEKAKVSVASKEVENFYNSNKAAFAVPEEKKVSMIVVPTESRANELLILLLQGQDFAALARDNSIDQESAKKGGDIGFIVRKSPFPQPDKKTMFEKFEQVAFALELNKPSTAFNGPDGYYIVKVTEVKEARQMLLSEVYQDIEQGLLLKKQEEALQALLGNLRKAASITVHDELLKE